MSRSARSWRAFERMWDGNGSWGMRKANRELYRLRKERLLEPSGKIRDKRPPLIRKGGKP